MPEKTDIRPRSLAIGAALVLGGIVASLGAAAFLTARFAAPATGPSRGEPPPIAAPRLQTAPREDFAAFLREKNELLQSGGPIQGDEAHVRIPLEQAMQMLAGRARR